MAIKKRDCEPIRVNKAARFALRNYKKYLAWVATGENEFVFMDKRVESLYKEFLFMGYKPITEVTMEPGMCYLMSNTDINGVRMVHPQPCYGYITKRKPGIPQVYDFQALCGIPGYTRVWRPKEELDEKVDRKKRRR